MGKFSLLFLATMGLYRYYWFYKNWSLEQERTGETLYPFLRTVFYPVFIFNLLQRISNYERKVDQHYNWNANFLSLLFLTFFLSEVWLSVAISQASIALHWSVVKYLFFLVEYYIFYKVQLVANRLANDAFGKSNAIVSQFNTAFIIFGFTLWYLNLYMLYMIFTGQAPEPGTELAP